MDKKSLGNALLIVGILIVLASLLADIIGIGDSPGFGRYQILWLIVGAIISYVGFNFRGQSD